MREEELSGFAGRTDSRPVCAACGGPGKLVDAPSIARPHSYHAEAGEWFTLVLCIDCGAYGVQAPYEPYASFIYSVRWPYSRDFRCHIGRNGGDILVGRWCDYKIRQAWPTMSEEERLAVENHRKRSYGRNPVDEAPGGEETDPLSPYLDSVEIPELR
jgi:hypothetical protein